MSYGEIDAMGNTCYRCGRPVRDHARGYQCVSAGSAKPSLRGAIPVRGSRQDLAGWWDGDLSALRVGDSIGESSLEGADDRWPVYDGSGRRVGTLFEDAGGVSYAPEDERVGSDVVEHDAACAETSYEEASPLRRRELDRARRQLGLASGESDARRAYGDPTYRAVRRSAGSRPLVTGEYETLDSGDQGTLAEAAVECDARNLLLGEGEADRWAVEREDGGPVDPEELAALNVEPADVADFLVFRFGLSRDEADRLVG